MTDGRPEPALRPERYTERAGARAVWLRTLRLETFRNYPALTLDFESGLNFLHGPNGSGKTSVLEAISYLAVARSLRGAGDGEVVGWGADGFGVGGDVDDNGTTERIVLRFTRGGRKDVTLGGEPLATLSELVGHLRVAWFSPEDTWITKGSPDARRRLLDMTLCQLDRGYLSALSDYRRALRQRNETLMAWAPDEESDRVVQTWTDRLVEYGGALIAARAELVPRLDAEVARVHAAISGEDALSVTYRSSVSLDGKAGSGGVDGEAAARACFGAALEACAEDERRRGFTLVGPHRDDLDVRLAGRALRSFGSQGQHRTAAIALKLGQAAILDDDGRGVVVLLDDVLSELDAVRGGSLVEHVCEHGQAFVTSTRELGDIVARGRGAASFAVSGGEVVRE